MKKMFVVIGLMVTTLSAYAGIEETTRTFVVDFSSKYLEDNDVQQCDDNYSRYAEIILKASKKDVPQLKAYIQEQCPGMKVKARTTFHKKLGNALSLLLDGTWDCELKFQNPEGGKEYTILLSDAC